MKRYEEKTFGLQSGLLIDNQTQKQWYSYSMIEIT